MTISKIGFGLNISDYSLEAAELSENGKVNAWSRSILEPGTIIHGRIHDRPKLVKSLNDLFAKASGNKFSSNKVVFSLPAERLFDKRVDWDGNTTDPSLRQILENKLETEFGFKNNELAVCEQTLQRNQNRTKSLYLATEKNNLREFTETLETAGLKTIFIVPEPYSLLAVLPDNASTKTILIIDVGAHLVKLAIFHNGLLWESNIKKGAGDKWTRAIAKAKNITFEDADNLKKEKPLSTEVNNVLSPRFQLLAEDINQEIKIFVDQEKYGVEKIYLTGGSAQIDDLKEYLQKKIKLPIEPLLDIEMGEKKDIDPWLFGPVYGCAKIALIKEQNQYPDFLKSL